MTSDIDPDAILKPFGKKASRLAILGRRQTFLHKTPQG
jgi:hypothetical protein